jgi:hypothetical protein
MKVPTFVSNETRFAQAMDVFDAVAGGDVHEQEDHGDAKENAGNAYMLAW